MVALRRALPMAMSLAKAYGIVGSKLARPSKMPGYSFGISAKECQRGGELRHVAGTVCERCYAMRGRYTCGTVVRAHARRLASLDHPRWVEAMAFLIYVHGAEYFRWFDSGDLQSLEHLANICAVCHRTPSTRHWLPTHEPGIVGRYLERRALPRNLVVRISADFIEDRPTTPTHGLPTSTVHRHKGEPVPSASGDPRESVECKSYLRENRCAQCRACWDPRVANISYPQH